MICDDITNDICDVITFIHNNTLTLPSVFVSVLVFLFLLLYSYFKDVNPPGHYRGRHQHETLREFWVCLFVLKSEIMVLH